jgi:hypothetical protein
MKRLEALQSGHRISLLNKLMAAGAGGWEVGGPAGSAWGMASAFGQHLLQSMREAGVAKSDALVRDAILNPPLALQLLQKARPTVAGNPELSLANMLKLQSMFEIQRGIAGAYNKHTGKHAYATGGKVYSGPSEDELVDRLMKLTEKSKKALSRRTECILEISDNSVAKALKVAQDSI